MNITHINNKAIAAYILWRGLDGTVEEIQAAYIAMRAHYGMPKVGLQERRIASVQSALCNEPFQAMIQILRDTYPEVIA